MSGHTELKPCPFCGGEAKINRAHQNVMLAMGEKVTDDHYLWTLSHTCSKIMSITLHFKPKTDLIAAWNTRTPDHTADLLEALRGLVAALEDSPVSERPNDAMDAARTALSKALQQEGQSNAD